MAGNQLRLLDDTGQVLRAMIADIEQAEHFCLLEFYIWSPGGRADDVAEHVMTLADGYVANAERLQAEQWAQRSGFQRLTENLFQLVSPLL